MRIYIVGDNGPEHRKNRRFLGCSETRSLRHNSIKSIHKTYEGALKSWNELRLELLTTAKSFLDKETTVKEMYEEMVENLSCEDPEKIDNYPQETPYIEKYDVEE